jgi:hypothetical protein
MTNKFENWDQAPNSVGIPVRHNSGSFVPTPGGAGVHDPRAGGEVRPGNFVPPSQGGQGGQDK